MLLAYGKKGSRPGGSPNSLRNNEHSEKGTLAPRKPHIRRRLPQFSQGKSVHSEVVHFCRFGISHFPEERVHSGVPFMAALQYSLRKSAHYLSFSFILFHFLSFFHVLSCSFIFFHFLSFSFIFFHLHVFIFFHLLSFSFVVIFLFISFFSSCSFFLGCSESFFCLDWPHDFLLKALM